MPGMPFRIHDKTRGVVAVSKRLRFEILRRDNHTCRYCGATPPDAVMTVDHVVAVALGGTDKSNNLVAACSDCNAGKSSVPADAPLIADASADDMRWGRAMQQAVDIERKTRSNDNEFVRSFILRMIAAYEEDELRYELPAVDVLNDHVGTTRTIVQFRDNLLDLDDLDRAIRKAMSNKRIRERDIWRYFCGICWRMIEDRQERARALIEAEDNG